MNKLADQQVRVYASITDSGDGVDCFINEEMRTISINDAIESNEYNALQDLPGYAEHGARLWMEIDAELIIWWSRS